MNYAWNIAASGVFTSMYRQDVAANNLANIETVGFKPDQAFTIPREAAREEDHLANLPSNALLERLGAGVLLAPTRTSFDQGALSQTGNPLDVAIQGDGFLTVQSSQPGTIRLTRDGRLSLNADGRLISAASGQPVLDTVGNPITLDRGATVEIDGNGGIRQNGQPVASLGFITVPDRRVLHKQGANAYTLSASAAQSNLPATGTLIQGSVEQSAVDSIHALMAVQNAATSVQSNLKVMQIQDELMNRAINTFGRVSA